MSNYIPYCTGFAVSRDESRESEALAANGETEWQQRRAPDKD